MRDKRFESLDGLKGIAACIVAFAWHYYHYGVKKPFSPFYKIIPMSYMYGHLMVELFFMISGFGLMVGYRERLQNHQIAFPDYMKRRAQKIYPLHIFALILVTLLQVIFLCKTGETFSYKNFDGFHFLLNLLGIQTGIIGQTLSYNGPAWFVTIILVQYCLFYYVLYTSRSDTAVICKFLLCSVAGLGIMKAKLAYPVFNVSMARGLACFPLGAIMYYVVQRKEKWIGPVAFAILLLSYLAYRFFGVEWIGEIRMTFILCFGPALMLSALMFRPMQAVLGCRILKSLGKLSTGIFFLHFPVQCAFKLVDIFCGLNINFASKKIWLLNVLLTLAVAVLYNVLSARIKRTGAVAK